MTDFDRKLKNKRIALVGWFKNDHRITIETLVRLTGGQTVAETEAAIDYIVCANANSSAAQPIIKSNEQRTAPAFVLNGITAFARLVQPDTATVLDWLRGGAAKIALWNQVQQALIDAATEPLDLRNSDLRAVDLQSVELIHANIEGSDFSNSNLAGAKLSRVNLANFSGAVLANSRILKGAVHCNFSKCDFSSAQFIFGNSSSVQYCNFSEANLQSVHARRVRFFKCNFENSVAPQSDFEECRFGDCRCIKTDFSRGNFRRADFDGSNLAFANLSQADFTDAVFQNSDLTNANFTESLMDFVDITHCITVGCSFNHASAKGTDIDKEPSSPVSDAIRNFENADFATNAPIETTVNVESNGVTSRLSFNSNGRAEYRQGDWSYTFFHKRASAAFAKFRRIFRSGTLILETITISKWNRGKSRSLTPKTLSFTPIQIERIVTEAWCNTFGTTPPSEKDLAAKHLQERETKKDARVELVQELCGGADGIKKFNSRSSKEKLAGGHLRRLNLSGIDLTGADVSSYHFTALDLSHCNFEGSLLKNTLFYSTCLQECSFRCSDLTESKFGAADLRNSDFSGATLIDAKFIGANLSSTDFTGAQLINVDFSSANIRGASFANTDLSSCKFHKATYDANTTFPSKDAPLEATPFIEKAKGKPKPNPIDLPPIPAPITVSRFVDALKKHYDAKKIERVISMLKAEKFELFADVTNDSIYGVIRSQRDQDLVYGCHILSTGSFCCCTQNLYACGGLRSRLCKHILLLIIGLVRAEKLEASAAYEWIAKSTSKSPELDRNTITEILLKFRGSQLGQLDWRPTETIPEDYYAF